MTTARGGSALRVRWMALPRAMKWAVLAGIGIFAYFLAVEPMLGLYERAVARGNADLVQLERLQARERELTQAQTLIALGVTRYGDAALRTEVDSGSVYQRLDSIFEAHGVRGYTIDSPRREQLEREIVSAIERVDPEADPQRQVFTVRFTASPEEVYRVLADLETAPEITAISSVNLRRRDVGSDGARQLEAVLTPEVWYVPRKVVRR